MKSKDTGKQLSSPFSTGGGGVAFENQVQTAFVALMLSGGVLPCLPRWPINKIKLQGRYAGYQTDDLIVFVEEQGTGRIVRLFAQIKHTISITENNTDFGEVIQAAWSDFNNGTLFNQITDRFALITGPLSARDIENVRIILELARHAATATDFFNTIIQSNVASEAKRDKLQAFRSQLKKANKGIDLTDDELWQFLKSFHLLGYDLDIRSGVTLSLLLSHISQFANNITNIWDAISREVSSFNQNAGTITIDTIAEEIRMVFSQRLRRETIPDELMKQPDSQSTNIAHMTGEQADSIMFASLLGAWNEKAEGDCEAIRKLIEGYD